MTARYKTPAQLHSAMTCGGVTRLQTIFKAAYAIEASRRVLDKIEAERLEDEDLFREGYIAGGMRAGIEVLSVLIQENAEELLDWMGATPWDGVPDDEESEQQGEEAAA